MSTFYTHRTLTTEVNIQLYKYFGKDSSLSMSTKVYIKSIKDHFKTVKPSAIENILNTVWNNTNELITITMILNTAKAFRIKPLTK